VLIRPVAHFQTNNLLIFLPSTC